MSILVDLYNLKLTGKSDLDKDKVIDFLNKYAPQVTRYLTAKDIEEKLKEDASNALEMDGTLGNYEYINGHSWFQGQQENLKSQYYHSFYSRLYRAITLPVIDTYLAGQDISKKTFIMVGSLTNNVQINLCAINENGQVFGTSLAPESLEPKKYTFEERKSAIYSNLKIDYNNQEPFLENVISELRQGGVNIPEDVIDNIKAKLLVGNNARDEIILGNVEYNLFQEILSLWNGKIEIRKCSALDCENIYIPSHRGREQEFCSNRCLKRIRKREKKNNLKKVAVLS